MNTIIYSRCSQSSQKLSNGRQIRDLKGIVDNKGWRLVKVFDEVISGYNKKEDRALVYEMIDYCKENQIQKILITELSRLGRDLEQIHHILNILKLEKISLYIQQFNCETLNDDLSPNLMSELVLGIVANIHSMEKQQSQFRLQSARREYVARGGRLGRKKGSIITDGDLLIKHNDIVKLLNKKMSIRNISKVVSKSVSTIQRVKKVVDKVAKHNSRKTMVGSIQN